jgi:hypothetical protein
MRAARGLPKDGASNVTAIMPLKVSAQGNELDRPSFNFI